MPPRPVRRTALGVAATSLSVVATLLAIAAAPELHAQVRLEIGAGATAWTRVVRDSITGPIEVNFDPGFAVAFRVGTDLDSSNTLQLGLQLARNTMVRTSEGTTSEITSVNVWFPSVSLTRPLAGALSVRGTLGALIYDPDDTVGTPFRDGSPVLPAAGVALRLALPFTNGLAFDFSWDVHRFNTAALKSEGFGGDQVVHRLSVLLQLGGVDAP